MIEMRVKNNKWTASKMAFIFSLAFLQHCFFLILYCSQSQSHAHSAVDTNLAIANITAVGYSSSTCRTTSLYPSTWPNDHGDSSRSKFTIGAGLPADVTSADLEIIEQTQLPKAMWLYTFGENSEFVMFMGGIMVDCYVAKADAKTLKVLQKIKLPANMYMGGMLMHRNGHVYIAHANTVYKFWNGDLYNSTETHLKTRLNGRMVQTNGMVVTSDGLLVIRQWSYCLEDMALFVYGNIEILHVVLALLLVGASSAVYLLPRKQRNVLSMSLAAVAGALLTAALLLVALVALLQYRVGPFDPVQFVSSGLFTADSGGGSELKLVDPDTLEVKHDVFISERCSGARTALYHTPDSAEDAIVLVGDEFVHQYRWHPNFNRLYEYPDWRQRYRSRNDGTFPGTGPAIHDGVVYFTDNTYPVGLYGHSYSMFRKPLQHHYQPPKETSSVDRNSPDEPTVSVSSGRDGPSKVISTEKVVDYEQVPAEMTSVHLTPANSSGFMFWSVVVSPMHGDVLVWDSAGQSVQMRSAADLSLKWQLRSINGDCAAIAADRDHVYLTDYSSGSTAPADYPRAVMHSKKLYPQLQKFFLVVDAATGAVRANITLQQQAQYSGAVIVPGAHNDVYIGASNGLIRVYSRSSSSD